LQLLDAYDGLHGAQNGFAAGRAGGFTALQTPSWILRRGLFAKGREGAVKGREKGKPENIEERKEGNHFRIKFLVTASFAGNLCCSKFGCECHIIGLYTSAGPTHCILVLYVYSLSRFNRIMRPI